MSWKLAELKWRQDLGLYETRWDSNNADHNETLPLARKQAIEAFEKHQLVPLAHRTCEMVKSVTSGSPQQQRGSLGKRFLQSTDRSLAALITPPAPLLLCHERQVLKQSSQQEHSSVSSLAVHGHSQNKTTSQGVTRSHSCEEPSHSSRIGVNRPGISPSTEYWRDSNFFDSSVEHRDSEASQLSTSREELTRLLDHIDSPGNGRTVSSRNSTSESLKHKSADDFAVSPSREHTQGLLYFDDNIFKLVNGRYWDHSHNLVSSSDSCKTVLPSTLSKHKSNSTLLAKARMPRFVRLPNPDDEEPAQIPSAGGPSTNAPSRSGRSASTPAPRVRRTTPIYQEFGEAYTSITGDVASPFLTSPTPGTDSLNNVYASAMAEDSTSTRPQQHTASVNDNQNAGSQLPSSNRAMQNTSVVFPFQRSTTPDSDEYMRAGVNDDNPAGMPLGSNDVPMTPVIVLRNVRRGSATPHRSPMPAPSTITYELTEEFPNLRPSVTFQAPQSPRGMRQHEPVHRTRSPYPQFSSEDVDDEENSAGVDNTLTAIVDHYRTQDTVPAARPAQQDTYQGNDTSSESIAQVGGPVLPSSPVRVTPDWPLPSSPAPPPAPPSSPAASLGANGERIFQPSLTYGSTRDLLNTTGLNGFSQLPGPLFQNGTGLDNNSLLHLRDALHNRQSLVTGAPYIEEDDAAWETTQGTNTQRNSAIPDGESFNTSSSPAAQPVSMWDPLATRGRQVEELEREFEQLRQIRQPNGYHQNEAAEADVAQGYGATSSPQQSDRVTSSSTPISPILRPTTLTTRDAASQLHFSSPQVIATPVAQANTPMRNRRNRITPSETLVDMSSDTAPNSASRFGTASDSDNTNNSSSLRRNQVEGVAGWRDNTQEQLMRSINEEIALYDPPPRAPRHFPEARLTTDKRVLEAEKKAAFVRRQRAVTAGIMAFAVSIFPVGGFLILSSMTENGPAARQFLLVLTGLFGGEPVNNINEEDVALAERVLFWGGAGWVGALAVLLVVLLVVVLEF